ncbi:reversion-inducing cysteine-rich protein with Kazal motifs isoform X2 [Belonocnema kinseyi]|uniref:reversion-inducing cysteine-rich protein with Kazal motifs isoform X2 n=1 Tax=Belonocnema kinseyi TaxID=2817044 RepID=UPI00143DBF0E|nr:reversion-inducing cysteine-rich protein with Kazal motifs isoform X2 [Belonocnema kinseyi]
MCEDKKILLTKSVKMWIILKIMIHLFLLLANSSFASIQKDSEKIDDWNIQSCCSIARNIRCRFMCKLFNQTLNINESCRRSDEPEFFSCIVSRQNAKNCCALISNVTCKTICKEIFNEPGNISFAKYYNNKAKCFNHVPKCLKSILGIGKIEDPSQYTHCCEKAKNLECLETCRRILRTASSEKEILDALELKCNPVKPHSPMWSCFLNLVPTKLNHIPLDAGKLSCCAKASTTTCENLCRKTYYAEWQISWQQFENDCLSSRKETEMRICLQDSDSSCKFGCNGLSFCSAFNKKFLNSFRSCSITADEAASREFDYWSGGGILYGLGVSLRAASSCPIKILRILACILHLQPCNSQTHETRICYNDCMEIVSTCVDWSSVTKNNSSKSLCSKFSSSSTSPCISIKSFLKDSYASKAEVLSGENVGSSCNNNPCQNDQICLSFSNTLSDYRCQPACKLGIMSKQLVAIGSWIQIPRLEKQGCYQICQCTLNGFERCKILNCFSFKSCWVQDRFISHNTEFYLECNKCRCFMGEITCFRKNCIENRTPTLPCDCPAHYVPVCSRLGVTYASSCLAKCAGFTGDDIEFGSCLSKDPCTPSPCNEFEKCIAKFRVCLSTIYRPCHQYECVPLNCSSTKESWEPVCDKNNHEHDSLCSLIKAEKKLGYRGPCMKECNIHEPVCSTNGESYPNECAALADRTIVDYFGPCVAVGLTNDIAKLRCISTVTCPELDIPYCTGVTPPGACCPVCGGASRLYYSRKQVKNNERPIQ